MKNKKGFTLIELIMVIVVIGIIAMIAIKSVTKRISDSKERAYNIQINNIKNATKKYMLENKEIDEYNLNTICVSLSVLQDKGYLEKGKIKNPKTDESFDAYKNFVRVKYNFEIKQYEYEFMENCEGKEIIPASKTIIDKNVAIGNTKIDKLYETTEQYIFKGNNPDNYLKLNNVLWRIVSIDKKTMMLKIVNLNGTQKTISEAGLLKDLNDEYELSNLYSKEFINPNSKWNSGVLNDSNNSPLVLKSLEKQSNLYNTIGLLSVSEYMDASLITNCYKTNSCTSYLSTNKAYWLLNKTNINNTWYVNENNKLDSKIQNSTTLLNVYPCLYLKTNSVISGGTGTQLDPYILEELDK